MSAFLGDFIGYGAVTLSVLLNNLPIGASEAIVTIGEDQCNSTIAANGTITCAVSSHRVGALPIDVNVIGYGKASGDATYEVVGEATSVTPSTGHIAGQFRYI